MPKLTSLVHADHRYTERLIEQLTADPATVTYDEDARKNLADYLVAAESRHETAEELVMWPAVRKRVPGGTALADQGLRQERDAKFVLDTFRFADQAARHHLAAEFAALSRAHIAFEEREVLPALKQATLWPGLHYLGLQFAVAKRLAPTRPHPRGPDHRFGLLTKGLLTAMMDRTRDKVTSRRT